MKEVRCLQSGSRWSLRLAWLLVLLVVGFSGVTSQEQPSTTTQTQTSDWVILESTRWNALTRLALTLETRLTERASQGEQLMKRLSESGQTIESLEQSVETLQKDLSETRISRDNWRTSLELERTAWSAERLELVGQRDRARNQRDKVVQRAAALEIRNRRNGLAWKIGIPVGVVAGALAWEVIR